MPSLSPQRMFFMTKMMTVVTVMTMVTVMAMVMVVAHIYLEESETEKNSDCERSLFSAALGVKKKLELDSLGVRFPVGRNDWS